MKLVHVYRNRADDKRLAADMHYCGSCRGWYGVPHDGSHCQQQEAAMWRPQDCACRYCKEYTDQPVEGAYGFWTTAKRWQP